MQAVTHFLVPALIVAAWRDFHLRKKQRELFPLHYVWIAGIAGIFPDFDFIIFLAAKVLGYSVSLAKIHQIYTHLLIIPLIILVFGMILSHRKLRVKICSRKGHRLDVGIIWIIIGFGYILHIFLDLLDSMSSPFIPFSNIAFGLGLSSSLGIPSVLFEAILDGVIFFVWISYLGIRHRIVDFI